MEEAPVVAAPAAGDWLGDHVRLVVMARVDARRQRREGGGRQARRGGYAFVHQAANDIRVAEDRRQRPLRLRALASRLKLLSGRAVRHPQRVAEHRRAREDAHGRGAGKAERRECVQQRVRVAAHRLVVVARDHEQRRVLAPPPDLIEDAVELPRVQHTARVPEVT